MALFQNLLIILCTTCHLAAAFALIASGLFEKRSYLSKFNHLINPVKSSATDTKPPVKHPSLTILNLVGVFFILIAATIALVTPCPSKGQYFVIYALMGVGIALLLAKSADKTNASFTFKRFSITLVGGVALPFILFFTNPIGAFKPDNCELPVSVTVFVHGKKGRQDIVLRQQGSVIMDVGKGKIKASINENGEAHFENLKVGDHVLLNIDFSEPYKSLYPDSVYVITSESAIYLPVALEGIDKVQGMVFYSEAPLPGVIVKIGELIDTTDENGSFTVSVPEALQRKEYKVWFIKPGFKTLSSPAFPPSPGMEINMYKTGDVK